MHHRDRGIGHELERQITARDGVHAVPGRRLEAELGGGLLAQQRQRRARHRPGAQGTAHDPRPGVAEARRVPAEGLDVREPVVREADGLGPLQMGVAGEHRLDVLSRPLEQDTPQLEQPALGRERDVAQKQREVGRDLVVPGPAGVELAGDGTQVGAQPGLDVHVDVFEGWIEGEAAVLDLARDPLEASD